MVMHVVFAAIQLAAVQHANEMCHASCFGSRLGVGTGRCRSGFCGDGACCKKGLAMPPCDGTMGCDGFQCCVDVGGTSVGAEAVSVPPRAPPPLPPLSECAIERIEYEIGHMRHDQVGDKELEVMVRVEPWRTESLVKLVYHQMGLDDGEERPIDLMRMTGATVEDDAHDTHGALTVRTIRLKLSDGHDAELKACRFGDVSVGAVGHVMAAVGLGTLEHKSTAKAAADSSSVAQGEAHQCQSGVIRFWSHGNVHKAIRRIGCHLAYDPPPPMPPGRPPPPSPHPPPLPPSMPPMPPKGPAYLFFASPPPPPPMLVLLEANVPLVLTLLLGGSIVAVLLVMLACSGLRWPSKSSARRQATAAKASCMHLVSRWMAGDRAPSKRDRLGAHARLSSVEDDGSRHGDEDDDDEDILSTRAATRPASARVSTRVAMQMEEEEESGSCSLVARGTVGRRGAAPSAPTPAVETDPFNLQLFGRPKGVEQSRATTGAAGVPSSMVPPLPRPPVPVARPSGTVAARGGEEEWEAQASLGRWDPAQAAIKRAAEATVQKADATLEAPSDPWEMVCSPGVPTSSATTPGASPQGPSMPTARSPLDDLINTDAGPSFMHRPRTAMFMDE